MTGQTEAESHCLEYWISRACDPFLTDGDRQQFITGFYEQVNNELEGHLIACRLLAHRIQSPHEAEALNALKVLEGCIRQCGQRFHNEVAKYRFLNELIRVVSPKYLGNQTSVRVKVRIMEILYSLQLSLKHLPKLKQVYDMLKSQGVITQDPTYIENLCDTRYMETAVHRSPFESDEKSELLSKLLRSRNPQDLQAANRLIKSMVRAEEQKEERADKRAKDMKAIEDSVQLLAEMIRHYDPRSTTVHDMEVIDDLATSLEKMRTSLFQYAAESGETEDVLAAVLNLNDLVNKTLEDMRARIRTPVVSALSGSRGTHSSSSSSEMSTSAGNSTNRAKEMNALEDAIILGVDLPPAVESMRTAGTDGGSDSSSALIELEDVFGIGASSATSSTFSASKSEDLPCFNVQNLGSALPPGEPAAVETKDSPKPNRKNKGLDDLQLLSQTLIEQNLPQGIVSTAKQKKSLKELSFKVDANLGIPLANGEPPERVADVSGSCSLKAPSDHAVDALPAADLPKASGLSLNDPFIAAPISASASSSAVSTTRNKEPVAIPCQLDYIFVPLDKVVPEKSAITILDKDGIKMLLYQTKNRPAANIVVLLLWISSTNDEAISDISLRVTLQRPQDFTYKLQPADASSLPAFNPISALVSISRVLLISSNGTFSQEITVPINYEFSFVLRGETHKETGNFHVKINFRPKEAQ